MSMKFPRRRYTCGIRKTIPISAPFNENRQRESGNGFQDVGFRFEERDVPITQYQGNHSFGYNTKQDLKDRFGELLPASLIDFIPEGLEYNWFYSDSKAETSIPSEVNISLQGATDENFQIPTPQVVQSSEAANFRFTELDDDVLNHGWEVKAPFYTKRLTLKSPVVITTADRTGYTSSPSSTSVPST